MFRGSDPQRRQAPGVLLSSFLSVVLLCVLSMTTSPQAVQAAPVSKLKLSTASVPAAAGRSSSSQFSLDSCVDQVMAEISESRRFRLQSGCGAAHSSAYVVRGIPANKPWALWALAIAVMLIAGLHLRTSATSSV